MKITLTEDYEEFEDVDQKISNKTDMLSLSVTFVSQDLHENCTRRKKDYTKINKKYSIRYLKYMQFVNTSNFLLVFAIP